MTSTEPGQSVELIIGGMTCASCAARVEKKLNRMDGVTATVNYATEKAKVTYAEGISTDDLVATVEKTGYTASLPTPAVANFGRRTGRAEAPAGAADREHRPRGPGDRVRA